MFATGGDFFLPRNCIQIGFPDFTSVQRTVRVNPSHFYRASACNACRARYCFNSLSVWNECTCRRNFL